MSEKNSMFTKLNGNDQVEVFAGVKEGTIYDFSKVDGIYKVQFDDNERFMYAVKIQGATIPVQALIQLGIEIGTADETVASIVKLGKQKLVYYSKSVFVERGSRENKPASYEWKKVQ